MLSLLHLSAADSTSAQHAAALELLAAAVALQPDAGSSLASSEGVAALSRFVGAPAAALALQADAADLLCTLAAVPVKREGVRQALTDEALPRALEIVHEAAAGESGDAVLGNGGEGCGNCSSSGEAGHRRRLQAAAAAIVAQLAEQDKECCHSILFHTQLLAPSVRMLVAGGRFAAAQQLLVATRSYAASLAPPSCMSAGSAGATCQPSAAPS